MKIEVGSYWKDWKITDLLGSGSYGTVYRIRREGLEDFAEECALKVIRIPRDPDEYKIALSKGLTIESIDHYFESVVEDLSSEISLMSQFKGNSNIVSFEDYQVEKLTDSFGWVIYIRMELLTPLVDILRDREISPDEVIRIGIDLCKALELCESENVIHRDIKEENIFLSPHGDYKLGDFGIAKQLDPIQFNQTKIGTPSHMAPEVYKGESYTSSVDIYSLGIVLYRLTNHNRNPFMPAYPKPVGVNDERIDEAKRASGIPYPPPSEASKEFSKVILRACAPRASDRYPDPKSLRRALEAVSVGKKPPKEKLYVKRVILLLLAIILPMAYFYNVTDIYMKFPASKTTAGSDCIGTWDEVGNTDSGSAELLTEDEVKRYRQNKYAAYEDGTAYDHHRLLLSENGRSEIKRSSEIIMRSKWSDAENVVRLISSFGTDSIKEPQFTKIADISYTSPEDLGFEGDFFLDDGTHIYAKRSSAPELDMDVFYHLEKTVNNLLSEDINDDEEGSQTLKNWWNDFWKALSDELTIE